MVLAALQRTDVFKVTAKMSRQGKAELKLMYLQCKQLGVYVPAVWISLYKVKACPTMLCPCGQWSCAGQALQELPKHWAGEEVAMLEVCDPVSWVTALLPPCWAVSGPTGEPKASPFPLWLVMGHPSLKKGLERDQVFSSLCSLSPCL